MARIGLVLHPGRDCSPAVGQVLAWTSSHGVELVASTDDVTRLGTAGLVPVPVDELAGTCDGIIALGGDGTLLGAMRLVSGRPIPVLGVNFGNLGFLAEVEGAELDRALTAMADGGSTVEMRGCLVVRHSGGESLVFNDAVVARVPGEGMVEATLSVSGRRYGNYRCDALILATPMGSTAYSYAAGGPVVSPGAEGIVVTPSASLSGIARTVVLGPNEPVQLELTGGRPAFELDGVLTGRLDPGEVLAVAWRPDAGRLVRLAGSRAADRSRVKLSLLDLPLLPQELQELVPESLRRRMGDGETDPR
jgi:NAD+ kinase